MNSMNKHTQNLRRRVKTQRRHMETKRLYFTCGKCKHIIADTCFVAHMEKCTPNKKVRCGKCKQIIELAEFVQHFHNCKGEKPNEPSTHPE